MKSSFRAVFGGLPTTRRGGHRWPRRDRGRGVAAHVVAPTPRRLLTCPAPIDARVTTLSDVLPRANAAVRPWLGTLVLLALWALPVAADFALTPADYGESRIVLADPVDDIKRFAAMELAEHLSLVTGHDFAIVEGGAACPRCFVIGPPNDADALDTEESRWRVTDEVVHIWGSDVLRTGGSPETATSRNAARLNHLGTVYAVYDFLEQRLGVRWLEPGDEGVVAEPRAELRLQPGEGRWRSPFDYQRNLRSYAWRGAAEPAVYLPPVFQLTEAQAQQRWQELDRWLLRMRMGGRQHLNFGHAFHTWWEEYGETHPEYFALNGNGERGPLNPDTPDRVKMCVSNPAVVEQAVSDWLEDRERAPQWNTALCMAQNDGGGGGSAEYCHCDACRALDVPREGEPFGTHLTDRYLTMANRAVHAVRREDPEALVTAYAYAVTEEPPRRERVEDGVMLQFVTSMAAEVGETRATYEGWQEMGANRLMFRPNDLCVELGLPLGHEERIWAHQQMAVGYGASGTDHDSVYGLWTGISGLTYYVLARSHVDPEAPFEQWVSEYAATFGAAQPEIEAYHAHWRTKFDETILPANGDERSDGGRGFLRWNGLGAVSTRIRQFYSERDFDVTDSLLAVAAARHLTPAQERRLERLRLGNRHNRLTFAAMAAVNEADTTKVRQAASKLLTFRTEHRDDLRINWRVLFGTQHRMGDATGITSLLVEERVADRRSFSAVRLSKAPRIDGALREKAWQSARLPKGMADNATAAAPGADAAVHIGWDDDALYIAVDCDEPHMEAVVENVHARDGAVWKDNAIELFVDGGNTGQDFHQLILTSGGALLDGRMTGRQFTAGWDATDEELAWAVARRPGGWSAEVRWTWAGLGRAAPTPGERIRFNVTRDRNLTLSGLSEATALSPTFGGFHAPARFATLTLSGERQR